MFTLTFSTESIFNEKIIIQFSEQTKALLTTDDVKQDKWNVRQTTWLSKDSPIRLERFCGLNWTHGPDLSLSMPRIPLLYLPFTRAQQIMPSNLQSHPIHNAVPDQLGPPKCLMQPYQSSPFLFPSAASVSCPVKEETLSLLTRSLVLLFNYVL